MNQLGDLLRAQRDHLRERGDTIEKIADRADMAQSVIYDHLRRREPFKQTPRMATLRKLAKGFRLSLDDVVAAAREATGPVKGNPLQLLLTARRVELDRTNFEASEIAAERGLSVSPATLSNILSGKHVNIEDETVRALAAGFDLPVREVRAAAKQARGKVTYQLPPHVEEQLSPEKWARIVKIVENVLAIEDEPES